MDDKEIERLAVAELLGEAKRGKERYETMGPSGWQKRSVTTNKRFLRNTLLSTLSKEQKSSYANNSGEHNGIACSGSSKQITLSTSKNDNLGYRRTVSYKSEISEQEAMSSHSTSSMYSPTTNQRISSNSKNDNFGHHQTVFNNSKISEHMGRSSHSRSSKHSPTTNLRISSNSKTNNSQPTHTGSAGSFLPTNARTRFTNDSHTSSRKRNIVSSTTENREKILKK